MTTRVRSQGPTVNNAVVNMQLNGNTYHSLNTELVFREAGMVDVVTPGFRKLAKAGILVNNPCSYTMNERSSSGGGFFSTTNGVRTYSTSGAGSVTQYFLATNPPTGARYVPPFNGDLLADIAQSKALGSIDKAPFSVAEDIAEMRETVRLLRDPLEAIRHLTDSLRRGGRRNPITNRRNNTAGRSMAEVWATGRFGYKPMFDSIETLVQSLGYTDVVDPANQVIRTAFGQVKDSNSVVDPDLRAIFGSGRYDQFSHGHSRSIEIKAYVHYRHYNPVRDWRWKYGLRAKDIPELLWAITPYSFLVDRISNISTSLRGVSNLSDPSIEFLGGGVVQKDESFDSWKYLTQLDPPYVCTSMGDDFISHSFSYNRTLWSPSILDAFVRSNFRGLVKDIKSTVDLMALTRLAFG